MKAVQHHRYGPAAEVLDVVELDRPVPGNDEVLIRVHAAGLGPHVWHAVTGLPFLARMGFGLHTPKSPIPSTDVAGVVEAVGDGVTQFRPGDEVYGTSPAGLAEYACATEEQLAPKPHNLSFQQAAAVPVSGCAALHAVRDVGGVQAEQQVLVIGASGGVGSFAVQIANAYGARVTGVCRTANIDFVRSLGAVDVIDYTCDDYIEPSRRYDLIVDTAGRRPVHELQHALTANGTLVIVGGEGGGPITGGFERAVLLAPLLSVFSKQRLRPLISTETQADLLELKLLIEAGKVVPAVTRILALSDAIDALSDIDEGHGRGKTVVSMPHSHEPEAPSRPSTVHEGAAQ